MSSWTPPAALKANNNESCAGGSDPGCTLAMKNGAYVYDDFAQYQSDSITAYRANGVDPKYVSIQNEPDFTPSYVGCRFNPTEAFANGGTYASYTQALDATYKAFQTLSNPPTLIGPETIGLGYDTIEGFLSALNPSQIGAVAHHLYTGGDSTAPDTFLPAMLQAAVQLPSKPIFETEYYQNGGLNTAWLIHNTMAAEEANAYLYWSYFWVANDDGKTPPDTTELITIDNPFALQTAWTYPPNGYAINDQYYGLEHFSRFVQPGSRRITALTGSPDLRVSAYLNARDERLIYVLINTSSTATWSPSLQEFASRNGATSVYLSVFSGTTERFSAQGPLGANNTVTLPPQSVATVVVEEQRYSRPPVQLPTPRTPR
jgi:glucuronoarabinoxylan endo-1,4-beta-xylanase